MAVLLKLFCSQQPLVRCISTSLSSLMKRPVFEGPAYPKRPLSPYMLFVKDTLPSMTDGDKTDSIRQVALKWHSLDTTKKQEYQTRAGQLQREHEDVIKHFMQSLGGEEQQKSYLKDLTEYRRKRKEYIRHFRLKKLGIVKPGSVSGYNLFMKEHRNQYVQVNTPEALKEGMKALNEKWKTLSEPEQKVYNDKGHAIYQERLKEYEQKYKKAIADGLIKPPEEEKEVNKTKKRSSDKMSTNKKSSKKST